MGIKADFYIGNLNNELKWIGSLLRNGSVWNIPLKILIQVNQTMFEELTIDYLKACTSSIVKWPHDWPNSLVTDYSYIFDLQREMVLMFMCGVDYLMNPIKIIQGSPYSEAIECYGIPKFPQMIPEANINKEELLKQYGYTLTESL